jgi:hypothetical protein
MDLHISVIADFKSANSDIEVIDWCLSGHAWAMNRAQDCPKYINPTTWKDLNFDMIRKFQNEYDSFLATFDGFITGHVPAFAMIYEKYNKPVLMINTCRYDLPFCFTKNTVMLEQFHECLERMKNRIQIVSNNRGDQAYTLAGTMIQPLYNPSLCLYTNARYIPIRDTFLCYNGDSAIHPLITQKNSIELPYQWQYITSFKGIIYFPYEISTMSMFEHFTAGCPMFFPSKTFLRQSCTFQTISMYWGEHIPNSLKEFSNLDVWIEKSDIYDVFRSPNTYYFDSMEHLFLLLETFHYIDDGEFRSRHIQTTKENWKDIIRNLMFPKYSNTDLSQNRIADHVNSYFGITIFPTRVDMLSLVPKHGRYGEIGVFQGEFTDSICRVLQPVSLVLYDLFTGTMGSGDQDGNTFRYCNLDEVYAGMSNFASKYPSMVLRKGDSSTLLAAETDGFDMIYIDGDNSYEGCSKDLESAYQKMNPGGWIMGHNYEINSEKTNNVYHFGVKQAVDGFCVKYNQRVVAKGMDGCVSYAIQVRNTASDLV